MKVFFLLFAFLLGSLFSVFVIPQSSYADVSDFSYTFTSSPSSSVYLCINNTSLTPSATMNPVPCSSYNYFYIKVNSGTYSDGFAIRYFVTGSNYSYFMPSQFISQLSEINSSYTSVIMFDPNYIGSFPSDINITVGVSVNNPFDSEPDCPVCPEVPDNPYDSKFDKLIVAVYTCGAIMLVIYFFYCIYRMIIKSTGGF